MERAIILAAGRGERLVNGKPYPKPLELVAGRPLIVRVIEGLARAGVEEVVVIVGYLGEVLIEALGRVSFQVPVRFCWNHEFDKPNGTSLLKAKEYVVGPTFLVMSDHLWSTSLPERVRAFPLADDETVLGIDYKIADCVDLDDATKVATDGSRVLRIGKMLEQYDALDTGVFRITPAVIAALEEVEGPQGCSLSQGMAKLAAQGKMRVVDVGDAVWVDVDTPLAHGHAEKLLAALGPELVPLAAPAHQG
ncbi:MAG: NTP transferase domain-containing protein [Myxococcales bacterium]|nr:NTP transferase domain-containing protein [Myxococcales bacterium]